MGFRELTRMPLRYVSSKSTETTACAKSSTGVAQKKNFLNPLSNAISSFAFSISFFALFTSLIILPALSFTAITALSAILVILCFITLTASSVAFSVAVFTWRSIPDTVVVILSNV